MLSTLQGKTWFASRRKLPLQVLYLALVISAMTLTGVRISKIEGRTTRSDTLAIVMGVKSIVLLSYQLITTYVSSMKRWKSLKAYMIIDYMEILFWFAVVVLGFMGVSSSCQGITCALGVVVSLVALLLSSLAAWLATIATLDRRYWKICGAERDSPATKQGVNLHNDGVYT